MHCILDFSIWSPNSAYHVQAHDRKPQGRSQNHHKKTKKKLTTPENVSSD